MHGGGKLGKRGFVGLCDGRGDGADMLRELQGLGKREDSISGFTGHSLI